MTTSTITCTNCGTVLHIEDVLSHDIEERFRKDFEAKAIALDEQARNRQHDLEERERRLQQQQQESEAIIGKRVDAEREKLRLEAVATARKEQETALQALNLEIDQARTENQRLKLQEVEMLRMQQQMKRQQDEMELTIQKRVMQQQQESEERIRRNEHERFELEKREWQKRFDDQTRLIEEMKRKAEQGSMQLQGEVQELAIEEYLRQNFPFDTIEEIKKGSYGADCVQIVSSSRGEECGRIYYESKRTKTFDAKWIDKFKTDMRAKGAALGILVTEAMPRDMDRFGNVNGVWVCSFGEFKALCYVLREMIVRIHEASSAQDNRGDKMAMLYDYLTGNEFRMQIEGIVEGFTQMQDDLESERRAMERLWKQREKQIQKVLLNTTHLYASIRGIAGNAIGTIRQLELPGSSDVQ